MDGRAGRCRRLARSPAPGGRRSTRPSQSRMRSARGCCATRPRTEAHAGGVTPDARGVLRPRMGLSMRRRYAMAEAGRATRELLLAVALFIGTVVTTVALIYPAASASGELRNRIPEAAPYVTDEAAYAAPPFEDYWTSTNHPASCQNCHKEIFDEWKGSMMANAWRDPVWRAAFLLLARQL